MPSEGKLPVTARSYCKAVQKRIDCKERWGCYIGCPLYMYLSILVRHLDEPKLIDWDLEVEHFFAKAITPERASEILGEILNERCGMTLEQVQEGLKKDKP